MKVTHKDESDSSDEESSSSLDSEEDSDTSTTTEEEVDVAFILLEENDCEGIVAQVLQEDEDFKGLYEVIEELMQPKVEVSQKQDLMNEDAKSRPLCC